MLMSQNRAARRSLLVSQTVWRSWQDEGSDGYVRLYPESELSLYVLSPIIPFQSYIGKHPPRASIFGTAFTAYTTLVLYCYQYLNGEFTVILTLCELHNFGK